MTRIAIFSDIHANAYAFDEVLADARQRSIDRYWMLGDAVGYGFDPKKILDTLSELSVEDGIWLAGNHDLGLVSLQYPQTILSLDHDFEAYARRPIQLHHRLLIKYEEEKHYIEKLHQLPFCAQPLNNVFLAHGAYYPENPRQALLLQYTDDFHKIENDVVANASLWLPLIAEGRPVLVIYGHHHEPALWQRVVDEPVPDEPVPAGKSMLGTWISYDITQPHILDLPTIYHINPGSIGFSRSKRYPCPSYVILETQPDDRFKIEHCFVSYDVEKVRQKLIEMRYPAKVFAQDHLQACTNEPLLED